MASQTLWSAQTAETATGGHLDGASDWAISGVSIDSREIAPGDLFVALKDQRDGHEFVASALEKGARAALVTHRPDDVPGDAPLLIVEDTLQALRDLARARRCDVRARICAITGSVGKTGTKEALRQALEPSGATHFSVKSFNNHFGVPLTLARMPETSEYGVFEIGMNHAGEITPLSGMVRPHVAIVTTVQAVHLEFFDSVEGIAEAKAEIFSGLQEGGTAILPLDNAYFPLLKRRAEERGAGRIITFGQAEGADLRLIDCSPDGSGLRVETENAGVPLNYRLGAPGRHLALNSLTVIAAVQALGADLDKAVATLADLRAPIGRGARHELALTGGTAVLVDESYNANPASMAAALATLGTDQPGAGGRRIAVLGDMLELGEEGPGFHARLAEPIGQNKTDLVFCAGPLMKNLWDALPDAQKGAYAPASSGLAGTVAETLQAGDIVMVKGSLGSAMRPIVDELLAKHGQQQGRAAARADGGPAASDPRRGAQPEGA